MNCRYPKAVAWLVIASFYYASFLGALSGPVAAARADGTGDSGSGAAPGWAPWLTEMAAEMANRAALSLFYDDGSNSSNNTLGAVPCRFNLTDSNGTNITVTGYFNLSGNNSCLAVAAINRHQNLINLDLDDRDIGLGFEGRVMRVDEDKASIKALIEAVSFQEGLQANGYGFYLVNRMASGMDGADVELLYGDGCDPTNPVMGIDFSAVKEGLFPPPDNSDLPERATFQDVQNFEENFLTKNGIVHDFLINPGAFFDCTKRGSVDCTFKNNICPPGTSAKSAASSTISPSEIRALGCPESHISSECSYPNYNCISCPYNTFYGRFHFNEGSCHDHTACRDGEVQAEMMEPTKQFNRVCDCKFYNHRFVLFRPTLVERNYKKGGCARFFEATGNISSIAQSCSGSNINVPGIISEMYPEPYPVNYDNAPPHEPAYEFLCFAPLVPAVCLDSQDEPHIHIGFRLQPSGENESSECFYLDDTTEAGRFTLRNGTLAEGNLTLPLPEPCLLPTTSDPTTSSPTFTTETDDDSTSEMMVLMATTDSPAHLPGTVTGTDDSGLPWNIIIPAAAAGAFVVLVGVTAVVLTGMIIVYKKSRRNVLVGKVAAGAEGEAVRQGLEYLEDYKDAQAATIGAGAETIETDLNNMDTTHITGDISSKSPVYGATTEPQGSALETQTNPAYEARPAEAQEPVYETIKPPQGGSSAPAAESPYDTVKSTPADESAYNILQHH